MQETEGVGRKRKLRFSCFDDINLLKQAVGLNPYEDNKNWRTVHQNFLKTANKPFTLRAIKDHVEHLLMLYRKNDLGNLRLGKAGTEKQHIEKQQLLQELFNFKEKCELKKKKKQEIKCNKTLDPTVLADAKDQVAYKTPEDMDLMDHNSPATASISATPFTPDTSEKSQAGGFCKFMSLLPKCGADSRREMSTGPVLEILEGERQKELDFEKRKLYLEERKVELESCRLALEEARLKYFLESQKQQHQLMLVLIEKIKHTNK